MTVLTTSHHADLTGLGALLPAQPVDLSTTPAAPSAPVDTLPPAGRYTVRAPEVFEADAFSASQAGFLLVRVDPVIVGPTHAGYQIRFVRCSAKTYTDPRTGVETSQIAEYLRAFGGTGVLTGDPQQAADLVAATAGQEAEVRLDWIAEHRPTGYRLRGMRNFPSDERGGFIPYVLHPDAAIVDSQGRRLRLWAHVEVTRWIPREP